LCFSLLFFFPTFSHCLLDPWPTLRSAAWTMRVIVSFSEMQISFLLSKLFTLNVMLNSNKHILMINIHIWNDIMMALLRFLLGRRSDL
jgi:hypothetical protein